MAIDDSWRATVAELSVKIHEKTPGDFVGGEYKRAVSCPECGRPAVTNGKQKMLQNKPRQSFAHHLSFSLDKKNNPVMRVYDVCIWVVK